MAYSTFINTVEAAKFLKEVEKNLVFAVDCTREYEGEVKQKGDQVRVLLAGKPTIYKIVKDETGGTKAPNAHTGTGKDVIQKNIGDAEEIENASFTLQINQELYTHYMVGNIDQAQSSKKGLINLYRPEAGKGFAFEMDRYIAKTMAVNKKIQYDKYVNGTTVKLVSGVPAAGTNEMNVLDFFDNLVLTFNDRDISDSTELVAEVSPRTWTILKKAYRDLDTDNSRLLAGRRLGVYNDITIKKTTGCYKADGVNEYVFIRTYRAVAFINPLTETKLYEPHKAFAKAYAAHNLFDAGIIRPLEVIAIKVEHGI